MYVSQQLVRKADSEAVSTSVASVVEDLHQVSESVNLKASREDVERDVSALDARVTSTDDELDAKADQDVVLQLSTSMFQLALQVGVQVDV